MRFVRLCITAMLATRMSAYALQPKPGDAPPPEIRAKIKALAPELERAMASENEKAVYEVVAKIRHVYGPFAGIPESPEHYVKPVKTDDPPLDALISGWRALFNRILAKRGCHSEIAKKNQMELRESASIATACLVMAEAGVPDSPTYKARAREELDYLLARQAESGLFPFPAYPAASAPNLAAMAERMRTEHPDDIKNGYFIADRDGGAQFDTGCCAYALLQGFKDLGNERYLAAARKAGDWAVARRLVANWNYNSFSVWQLSALYDATKERKYLDAAVEKAILGVLPGLMENGRWVDPHNAKQSYHFIMLRALNELLRVLPKNYPRYGEIRDKTVLAANSGAKDILRNGVSNSESALIALSLLQANIGPKPLWHDAANAIVNALIAAKKGDPISLPFYIRYRSQPAGIGRS